MKPKLLEQSRGKFALVKSENLIGIFDSDQDAYKAGLEKFGSVPFLIVRIDDSTENAWIPALTLGLLNASI